MNDLEKCKKYLRSILLASKGGVPGAQVVARYKDIVGESVPYRKFNFSNLENFLQSIPDVCRITVRGRDVMVVGVETPETKHIKDLIQRQGKGGGKHGGGGGRPAPVNLKLYSKPQFSQSNCSTRKNFGGSGMKNPYSIGMKNISPLEGHLKNISTNAKASPASHASPITYKQMSNSVQFKQPPPRKPQPAVAPVKITPRKVTVQPTVKQPGSVSQVLPVTKESVKVWSGRVRKLLEGRPHGLFKTQVERFHEKQYQERLPDNWADMMLNFSEITMKRDPSTNNILVFPVSKTDKTDNNNLMMPDGAYPSDANWSLAVSHVESTSIVWVIFDDERKRLDNIQASLRSRHESGTVFNGGSLPQGHYFSAQLNSGKVMRIKVLKVDRMKHKCQAFLLDVGKVEDIDWARLVPLDRDFVSLPAMAMKVILAGVDESRDLELCDLATSTLLDRQLVARSVGKGPNDIPRVALFHGTKNMCEELQCQLYTLKNDIKSGYCQTPINNNQAKVMNGGIGMVKNLSLPPTPAANDFYDLRISHIVSPHEIYFQSYTTLPRYDRMTGDMKSFYSCSADSAGHTHCSAGMFVAVRHLEEWKRGKVRGQYYETRFKDNRSMNLIVQSNSH